MSDVEGKRLTICRPPDAWDRTQELARYYQRNYSQTMSTPVGLGYLKQRKNIALFKRFFPEWLYGDKGEGHDDVRASRTEKD